MLFRSPEENTEAFTLNLEDSLVNRIKDLQDKLSQEENQDLFAISITYTNDITLNEGIELCWGNNLPITKINVYKDDVWLHGYFNTYPIEVELTAFNKKAA